MARKIYPKEAESIRARQQRLRAAKICVTCGQRPMRLTGLKCDNCWKVEQQHTRTWRRQIMQEVILKYGGKCYCCGETTFAFLTLDHMNNDGHLERKQQGYRGGYAFYKKLRDLPLREDLQVACYNCNIGRTRNGGVCPHCNNWEGKG